MCVARSVQVSSERVTQTFCQRAHHLGLKRLNAVTEEFYDVGSDRGGREGI